jgi:hypothetical protein
MGRLGTHRETVELTLDLANETDKALCVENEKGDEVWIPKAMCIEWVDNENGTCTIEVSEQIAFEKELI